jgi:hypothetical protein
MHDLLNLFCVVCESIGRMFDRLRAEQLRGIVVWHANVRMQFMRCGACQHNHVWNQ